jgi:ABC-type lipoprotein release transport system permease subunit
MKKTIGFLGLTIGSAIGWWVTSRLGTMSAFIGSTVGSGVGLFLAKRWADEHLP